MTDSRMPDEGQAKDLIPLTNNEGIQAVMGRELHKFLEITTPYRKWFPRMVEYGFTEGQDYADKNVRVERDGRGAIEMTDHILSLDMAKEISMIQRTAKGKQAREYFIECEKRVQVNRYSAYAGKNAYFLRIQNHEVPRFRGEPMHTLKVTPTGAEAIHRALCRWGVLKGGSSDEVGLFMVGEGV